MSAINVSRISYCYIVQIIYKCKVYLFLTMNSRSMSLAFFSCCKFLLTNLAFYFSFPISHPSNFCMF